MTTSRCTYLITWPLAVAVLVACASGPKTPVYTSADIAAAERSGSLEELYDQVSASLAAAGDSKEAAALRIVRQEIGEKLAAQLKTSVEASLAQAPRIDGLLPLDSIEAQRARLAPLASWHPSTHQVLTALLDAESRKTNTAIGELRERLGALTREQVLERLQLLDRLSTLAGPGADAQLRFAAEREEILAGLSRDAAAAIEAEDYEKARGMLAIVQEARPEDTGAVEQLAAVDTKYFEKNFWQALEKGQPDEAYALLTSISQAPSFDRVRVNLAGSSDVMVNYYVTLGAAATKRQDLREAHRRFGEARNIRRLFGSPQTGPVAEEKPFLELVHQKYEAAAKQNEMGLAWGYLQVIADMQEITPELRRELRETKEAVVSQATKRLSAAPFDDPADSQAEFGDAVGSKVMQYLFQTIPNDIRLIEREQLSDIIREKSIGGTGGEGTAATAGLAAADYLVQGTILEAKVDSTEKRGKRTMRVVTEQEEVPNPEYNRWLNLSSKEREKTPEPARTVIAPRKEDVTVEVTLHRKVGIFSVSYRLIEAATAKVLFANSARAKQEYEDTSSEGVELGEFKMEFKLASLPSDIEILAQLADQISETIGAELARVLANPEESYRSSAEAFVKEGNYRAAAREYANCIVLSEQKGADVGELLDALRGSAVSASLP